MSSLFVEVALDVPLAEALTYRWPPQWSDAPRIGQSVIAPLGRRRAQGVIVGVHSQSSLDENIVKDILEINEDHPLLPAPYLEWMKWMSSYYLHPFGRVVAHAFPPLKKKGRGSKKSPLIKATLSETSPLLTEEQQAALQGIRPLDGFAVHLLHGVTGSGKTEVYIDLFTECLTNGKQGLLLVPEIALTPQLIRRFAQRLGDEIAVLHSHLTEREKTEQWWLAFQGERRLVIGARSALFCPLKNLGLIVIDEEHEASFKQDEKLKYHARDSAIMLAKTMNCPVVLGSATPSLETYWNSKQKKFQYHPMLHRVDHRPMPRFTLVDLRQAKEERRADDQPNSDLPFWLSPLLHTKIEEALKEKHQTALFLNRRGIAPMVLCQACGFVYECPNCAISLTLHGENHLVCHYCDYSERLTDKCKSCGEESLESPGLGTELLEKDLARLFPEARLARCDRDEVQNREQMEELIEQMESGEIDILIGTQMIAKGLDFPRLNLVGLVLIDVGFNLPDFRATERSFQLITQVAGRAGRHSSVGGEVVIQTFNPENPAITFALEHNSVGFCEQELGARQDSLYPPFIRLAEVRLQAPSKSRVEELAQLCNHRLLALQRTRPEFGSVSILGPAPAPLLKLRNKYRYHALLKCSSSERLHIFSQKFLGNSKWIPAGCKVQIDIDPSNML